MNLIRSTQVLFLIIVLSVNATDTDPPRRDLAKTKRLSTAAHDVRSSPARIALMHMANNVWFFQELSEITLRNKRRYATRHNFEMVVHTPHETSGLWKSAECDSEGAVSRKGSCYEPTHSFALDERAPTFGKIKLAIAACVARPDYWLLWSDADALIVNQKRSLLEVVDDAYDIIIASDWFMVNAGVILLRCSLWNINFLKTLYEARNYDHALALDQSAFNDFLDKPDVKPHVKHVPKWLINVYTEEYQPGDFILHFAGKLYEATPWGIGDIARQFDVLSRVDDDQKIAHFFNSRYLLNYFSGTCVMGKPEEDPNRDCDPYDSRRMRLPEPLGSMSYPNRYRQLEFRNPRLKDWKDPHDILGATDIRKRRSLPVAVPH